MHSKILATSLLLITLSQFAYSLSCNAAWECMSVSEDFNFVECIDNQCACRTSLGFIGEATTSDKCRCNPGEVYWGNGQPFCKVCQPPAKIIYDGGIPYCVDAESCEATANEEVRQAVHRDVVRKIYENLIYPTPVLIIGGQFPIDDLFSPDARGRVTPVGAFDDFLSVEEYFYALAATPTSIVLSVNIKSLISTGNLVGVEVDILFNSTRTNGLYNLTQMGFYEFDETDRVKTTDLVILNLGAATDPPVEERPVYIQQLCGLLTTTCADPSFDPEGFYTDFNDCVTFMNSIPFGSWNRANSNTVVCRQLHSILTLTRPEIHCSHSGKLGGGKCIDFSYDSFYEQEY